MSAAETIPFAATKAASQPWSPTDRDRLIFQWVKFDGHKQSWVSTQLGIHQTTVSRIVERYERWIAHGGPSQQGGLSRDERLRAQRWLTYERNEWVLNAALRIAGEMEHATDISQTTITRSPQDYTKETEIRTQHATLHRSGLAARFLRLAHRINMDQLELIEQNPLPDLEPLSIEDLSPNDDLHVVAGPHVVAASPDPATAPTEGLPPVCHGHPARAGCHGHPARADRSNEFPPQGDLPNTPYELADTKERTPTAPSPPPMHKTHTEFPAEQPLTACPLNDYDQNQPTQKISTPAYPVAYYPPEGMNSDSAPCPPVPCPPEP